MAVARHHRRVSTPPRTAGLLPGCHLHRACLRKKDPLFVGWPRRVSVGAWLLTAVAARRREDSLTTRGVRCRPSDTSPRSRARKCLRMRPSPARRATRYPKWPVTWPPATPLDLPIPLSHHAPPPPPLPGGRRSARVVVRHSQESRWTKRAKRSRRPTCALVSSVSAASTSCFRPFANALKGTTSATSAHRGS